MSRLHLNHAGAWPSFEMDGLIVTADGALELAPIPGVAETIDLPADISVELGGLAILDSETILLADGVTGRVVGRELCDTDFTTYRPGDGDPVIIAAHQRWLYVAKQGGSVVEVWDLVGRQLRAEWQQFEQLAQVAVDAEGNLWTVDGPTADRQLRRFADDGTEDPSVAAAAGGAVPADGLAIGSLGDHPVVVALDRSGPSLSVYELDGTPRSDLAGGFDLGPHDVKAVVTTERFGYVANHDGPGLVSIPHGPADIPAGPVTGVGAIAAITTVGPRCWVVLGHRLLAVDPDIERVQRGSFLGGPFWVHDRPAEWKHLQLVDHQEPDGTTIEVFTRTEVRDAPVAPPDPDPGSDPRPTAGEIVPVGTWWPAPGGNSDWLLLNEPGRYLWFAGQLTGDGRRTPRLRQVGVTWDHPGWVGHLPAIYRTVPRGPFLDRSLALLEQEFQRITAALDNLPRELDPDSAAEPFLDWLATLVGSRPNPGWDEERRRRYLGTAFDRNARRGTVDLLIEEIGYVSDRPLLITEPGRRSTLWRIGDRARLGFDATLAAAAADGAVLGTAAIGSSTITDLRPAGEPSRRVGAHRLCVRVLTPGPDELDTVQRVVEREKPAHVRSHVCAIEPGLRIGLQATVGVDTIVGQDRSAIDHDHQSSAVLALAGSAHHRKERL